MAAIVNDVAPDLVKFKVDLYGGVLVDSDHQNYDLAEFEKRLEGSIPHWQLSGIRGVWIRVSRHHATLVPVCARNGFDFHHAQPGYVMMTRWLPPDRPCTLPQYANHYLGCAGFVVNDRDEVLVVKERYTTVRALWKLPGGHANTGEDIGAAAVRETLEETGVHCQFVAILCIRHMHKYRYGLSDLYVVCLLKPLTQDIKMCEAELVDAKWIKLDEFLSSDIAGINRFSGDVYRQIKAGVSLPLVAHDIMSWDGKRFNRVYSAATTGNCDVTSAVAQRDENVIQSRTLNNENVK